MMNPSAIMKMMNAKNALEIGTSNGYSGLWISKALKETGRICGNKQGL